MGEAERQSAAAAIGARARNALGHRAEVERFGELVANDVSCGFEALSYGDHWRELDDQEGKPAWLDAHLIQLRRRYDLAI